MNQSIDLSTFLFISLSTCISLSVYSIIHLSIYLSLPIFLPLYSCVCVLDCPSIYISIDL